MIHLLMNAEADAVCGAEYGQRSTERNNQRNGYRPRKLDTRMGTLNWQFHDCARGVISPNGYLNPGGGASGSGKCRCRIAT